jgi:hypothetical protein
MFILTANDVNRLTLNTPQGTAEAIQYGELLYSCKQFYRLRKDAIAACRRFLDSGKTYVVLDEEGQFSLWEPLPEEFTATDEAFHR